MSDETGRNEVYVRPFPEIEEGIWQVSRDGGVMPTWALRSQELFYRTRIGNQAPLMVVPYDNEPVFSSGTPKELVADNFHLVGYNISPDGQHFLMLKEPDAEQTAQQTTLIVVENWFSELNRLAPPSR